MSKKKKKTDNIPMHTDELTHSAGFRVEFFDMSMELDTDPALEAHRDDHYVFYVQTEGYVELLLDFETVRMEGFAAGYIRPGQIHHYLGRNSIGYFIAVDPSLPDNQTRTILDHEPVCRQIISINEHSPLIHCIKLLLDEYKKPVTHPLQLNAQRALVTAFTSMLAAAITQQNGRQAKPQSRADGILIEFRKLVKQHFLMAKSAGQYALMLNISTAYLNEVVKQLTGFTASYWIQHEILLEAKRLLVHTDLSAKEIAYRTGYDDPTYFSRLFKKATGCSPLDFRGRHHELSNQIL